jgi:uncharacterized membrane protein YjjB (DUF3815 family)
METILLQSIENSLALSGLAAYAACVAFGLVYGLRGRTLWASANGGALGWTAYKLLAVHFDSVLPYFIATLILSIFSEIMSRVLKQPATVFLTIALLPLVPGAGIYYTMRAFVDQDMAAFATQGANTLSIAAMLALGILMITTLSRIIFSTIHSQQKK